MDIRFNWIGGATFILSIGSVKIAVDPVLCKKGTIQDYFWFKSKRVEDPLYTSTSFCNIDIWLITHNHEDHMDEIGLSEIDSTTKVFCNQNAQKKLILNGKVNTEVINWHSVKTVEIKGYTITIEAIPAIHGVNPISALFTGKVNGYYVTVTKNSEQLCVYITSDTVYKKSVIDALNGRKIDLLIPNMGAAKEKSWIMTLTLNSKMLQRMINELKPKIVIPVHYGTFEHYKEPVTKIEALNNSIIKIVDVGSTTSLF